MKELVVEGIPPELIDAAVGAGTLIRVSSDLVFLPGFVDEAIRVVRAASEGISVTRSPSSTVEPSAGSTRSTWSAGTFGE